MNNNRQKLLHTLKNADRKGDVPSISEKNAQFLAHLITARKFKQGLEIGTAHAYSTIWLADAFEQNQGHLTTIEHSFPSFNQAKINLYRAKLESRVTQYLGRAQEILSPSPDSLESGLKHQKFDFIFIDGIKKSTAEFFELCAPFLSSNGVIVIDDVIKFKTKMQSFYDFLNQQNQWRYDIKKLDEDDGIMIIEPIIWLTWQKSFTHYLIIFKNQRKTV